MDQVADDLDLHLWLRRDVRGDPNIVFGSVASVSVFALAGVFLGAVVKKSGEDAYEALKRLARKATQVRHSGSNEVHVVLHDVEHNMVIECPQEVPAEAAFQLARMRRDELRRIHLRWNSETQQWDRVGENLDSSRPSGHGGSSAVQSE